MLRTVLPLGCLGLGEALGGYATNRALRGLCLASRSVLQLPAGLFVYYYCLFVFYCLLVVIYKNEQIRTNKQQQKCGNIVAN